MKLFSTFTICFSQILCNLTNASAFSSSNEVVVDVKNYGASEDPLFWSDGKYGFGFGLSFFHLQLFLFSLAFFSWQSVLHYTMRTIWNILFPLTIITAGTYNSLRPAMATVGTQTWAVGLLSLKALKQTTKIPKYSWYGLQLLLLAPLRLINVKSGKKNNKRSINKLRRQSRNRLFHAEEGAAINQDDDDDDDDGDEQNYSEDEETTSFIKTSISEGLVTSQINLPVPSGNNNNNASPSKTRFHGYRRGCFLIFKRPTQQSFLTVYRTIPLRLMSRIWGRLMQIRLPKPLRKPIIHIYAAVYGCNLTEIQMADVSSYSCLGEFFRRRLRPEVRPIDSSAPLTSPADGKIVRSGLVQNAILEQIKGVTYSLSDFLGSISWKTKSQLTPSAEQTTTASSQSSPAEETCHSSPATVVTNPTSHSSPAVVATTNGLTPSTTSPSLPRLSSSSFVGTEGHEKEVVASARDEEEEEKEEEKKYDQDPDVQKVIVREEDRRSVATSSPSSSSLASVASSSASSSSSLLSAKMTLSVPASSAGAFPLDFDAEYQRQICVNDPSTHKLHHLVVYLAPGDYHRFHSPADWTVTFRRHFPGDLFSVAPLISRWISGLFNYNERVFYAGFWEHGFFSLTAVGATGVGSIRTHLDPNLSTNEYKWNPRKENHQDLDFTKNSPAGIRVSKGEEFGEFNLGSTIVIVFEAPNDFRFQYDEDDKVKVGQSVGSIVGQSIGSLVGQSVGQTSGEQSVGSTEGLHLVANDVEEIDGNDDDDDDEMADQFVGLVMDAEDATISCEGDGLEEAHE